MLTFTSDKYGNLKLNGVNVASLELTGVTVHGKRFKRKGFGIIQEYMLLDSINLYSGTLWARLIHGNGPRKMIKRVNN